MRPVCRRAPHRTASLAPASTGALLCVLGTLAPLSCALASPLLMAGSALGAWGGPWDGLEDGSGQDDDPGYKQGTLRGSIGFDRIGDDSFVLFSLRPELAIGRLGIGLGIPLRMNISTGELREEDWDSTSDYLGIARYVRWAHKRAPLYIRLGALDNATLGHGSIVRHYSNALDADERHTGLVLDLNRGSWGLESLFSNFAPPEVMGIRSYLRPFANQSSSPLGSLAFGASLASDVSPNPFDDADADADADAVTVYGFDVDLPIVRRSAFSLSLYYDFAQIVDFGHGHMVGAIHETRFPANSLVLGSRLERRFMGDQFTTPYFGHFYEIERATKRASLAEAEEPSGWFAEASARVLGTFDILGSYQWADEDPNGWMHIETRLPNVVPGIRARATYDRLLIDEVSDIFSTDEDAHLRASFGYQLNPWLWMVGEFHRTWELESEDPVQPIYVSTDRYSVRLELDIPLSGD